MTLWPEMTAMLSVLPCDTTLRRERRREQPNLTLPLQLQALLITSGNRQALRGKRCAFRFVGEDCRENRRSRARSLGHYQAGFPSAWWAPASQRPGKLDVKRRPSLDLLPCAESPRGQGRHWRTITEGGRRVRAPGRRKPPEKQPHLLGELPETNGAEWQRDQEQTAE